jgi:hypothetical protein
MLSDKDRVLSHRSLFAVIRYIGGCESLLDEPFTVLEDLIESFRPQIVHLEDTEVESAAEVRSTQSLEEFIQIGLHFLVCFIPRVQDQNLAAGNPYTRRSVGADTWDGEDFRATESRVESVIHSV